MFETLNHRLFELLSAPPEMTGGALLAASLLAQGAMFIAPALLVSIWMLGDNSDRCSAVGACLSALLALSVASAVSGLYFHSRPFMDGVSRNYLHHAADSSFPSDHSTLLFALGWSLLFVPPPSMRLAWIIPMSLAVAVGWSRVFLGAHYPMDIVGAALIALASAFLFSRTSARKMSSILTSYGERVL